MPPGKVSGPSLDLRVVDDVVIEAVREFVSISPRTVALSGGTTPCPFYRALAGLPYPWLETHFFFGDERCVSPGHPDSNEGMAREAFLDHVPAVLHSMAGGDCTAAAYEADLRTYFGPGLPRFDLAVLGLGADGHTASLFPGDPALESDGPLVARVERPDHPRLTLTLPVLSNARTALFLVCGQAKAPVLRRLVDRDLSIPAARVAASRVVVITDIRLAVGQ